MGRMERVKRRLAHHYDGEVTRLVLIRRAVALAAASQSGEERDEIAEGLFCLLHSPEFEDKHGLFDLLAYTESE